MFRRGRYPGKVSSCNVMCHVSGDAWAHHKTLAAEPHCKIEPTYGRGFSNYGHLVRRHRVICTSKVRPEFPLRRDPRYLVVEGSRLPEN